MPLIITKTLIGAFACILRNDYLDLDVISQGSQNVFAGG